MNLNFSHCNENALPRSVKWALLGLVIFEALGVGSGVGSTAPPGVGPGLVIGPPAGGSLVGLAMRSSSAATWACSSAVWVAEEFARRM